VARTSDRLRAVVVAVMAVLQVTSGLLVPVLWPSLSTRNISDANMSQITPAGWAFSIWALIYAGCLALAIYQLLPSQQPRQVHRRSGWWLVTAFAASTAWVPIFGARAIWLSQLLIVGLVVALVFAARGFLVTGPAPTTAEVAFLRVPIMFYLGWAVVASAAGFATTFRAWGMPASARWAAEICVVLVLSATITSLFVVGRMVAVGAFLLSALWGLLAIAVETTNDNVRIAVVLAIVVLLCSFGGRILRSPRRRVVLVG
jgi:hypothetical protein